MSSPGGLTFSRGGGGFNFFHGPNHIFKEIHITCDFLGRSGPQIPPLDPYMQNCNLGLF